jgi:hypothetical protein
MHDDRGQAARVVNVHVCEENLLKGGNIAFTPADALESSATCIQKNPRLSIDGQEVSS